MTREEREALQVVYDLSPQSLSGYATEAQVEAALKQDHPASGVGVPAPEPDRSAKSGAADLQIQSRVWARILWAVLGGAMGVFAGALTVGDYHQEGFGVVTVIGLAMTAIGAGSALIGSRPSWIRVDGESVTYIPPIGKPKTFPRSSIGRITRVNSSRGGSSVRFLDRGGKKLFSGGMGFENSDIHSVAKLLGVSFY